MANSTVNPHAFNRAAIVRWTLTRTLGCLVGAVIFNFLLFRSYAPSFLWIGVFSACIISLAIAGPLFFRLGLKRNELASLRHKLNEVASVDKLTLCLDGAVFSGLVDSFRGIPGTGRRRPGALLAIDADHLKSINERFGRTWGDEALRVVAGAIKASVRAGDLVGRLGGEEFGVFLPGASGDDAKEVAERIRKVIAETLFEPGGKHCPLSVSVGAVVFEDQLEFDDVFRAADQVLLTAKKGGRNRIELTRMPSLPSETVSPRAQSNP